MLINNKEVKAIDEAGKVRLDHNSGESLPYAQSPDKVVAHIDDDNIHVTTTKGGLITFIDNGSLHHEVTIIRGLVSSWKIEGSEQLS